MNSFKNLIILRPVHTAPDNLRLGLYTDAFEEFVTNNVTSLFVDFGEGLHEVTYLTTYINEGSIVGKELINGWLQQNGFLTPEQLLLFELEVSHNGQSHIYHYIGKIVK